MSIRKNRLELTKEEAKQQKLRQHNQRAYKRGEAHRIAAKGCVIGCNESDPFAYDRIYTRVMNDLYDAEPEVG